MQTDQLLALMTEANFDPWESVSCILEHPGERAKRLRSHIQTKLMYWQLIATALNLEQPFGGLLELMNFEIQTTSILSLEQRQIPLEYSGRILTVEALIRLSARHSVWHAGQIALTKF